MNNYDDEALSDMIIKKWNITRNMQRWRLIAIIAIIALAVFFGASIQNNSIIKMPRISKPHIARVNVTGVILSENNVHELLKKLEEEDSVKAVFLHLNSPGGSSVGGELLYQNILALNNKKPVIILIDEAAASAAYMAALGGEYIFAYKTSITGSIGAMIEYTNIYELANKFGVNFELYKSVPLKASPNQYEPTSKEAANVMYNALSDVHETFVSMVGERRKIPEDVLRTICDGRIYTGLQAFQLRLIDAIGGETEAKKFLIEKEVVKDDIETYDYTQEEYSAFGSMMNTLSTHITSAFMAKYFK